MSASDERGSLRSWEFAKRILAASSQTLILACSLLLPGCGHEDETELRFWAFGREGEVAAQLIPEFERAHPNLRVHVQQIPWTAAHEKLLTAHVGGSTPDVAQLGNTWVPEFAAIHALTPLDTVFRASRLITRAAYFPGIWDTNVVDDSTFGIPWYVDTRVLFYRKDILKQAGYDSIPQSWSAFVAALRAIKRVVGPDRYPLYLPTNEWSEPVILGQQNGSTLLRDRGRYGAFSEPPFREAFDFYLSLFREGLAPVQGLYDVANPYQEFARGYFTMWITGPWNMEEFRKNLPPELQDKWGTAPLPGPDGPGSGSSTAGGSSLVLFRNSRHPAEAAKLIEFLSQPEQQARFYQVSGDLPARPDAWQLSKLAQDQHARAFWIQLQRVKPLPAVPEIEAIMSKVIAHAEASIRGGKPAEQALKALDEDVNTMLAKRRWVMDRAVAKR